MLTMIKTEKTIWIGMTEDQVVEIKMALVEIIKYSALYEGKLKSHEREALNDLRQALLNV